MKILIAGASGLIGQALVRHLKPKHQLSLLGRNTNKLMRLFGNDFSYYSWQEIETQNNPIVAVHDVVINLAGENIGNKRWSDTQKEALLNSRVKTTQLLATACANSLKNVHLLNANAIGIYDFDSSSKHSDHSVDEATPLPEHPNSFLAEIGKQWQQALAPAEQAGLHVTKMRFSVALSKQGGVLKQLLPSFKLGFGAVLGNGQQPFSWIALTDLVHAIEFLIEHRITGPINLVAPEVVSQKTFANTLAKVLRRPRFLWLPAWLIKLGFGQMGEELLLNGQHASCKKLLSLGFRFHYPNLAEALRHELLR